MDELETKLILSRWVTPEQHEAATKEAVRSGKSLWASLVKLGFLSERTIKLFFAGECSVPYVSIPDYKVDTKTLRLLEEQFCREHVVLPLFVVKGVLFVACSNPLDTLLIDRITALSGYTIEPLMACAQEISQALDEYYGPQDNVFSIQDFLVKQSPLQGLSFRRESERLELVLPVEVKVNDKVITLQNESPIKGYTRNISASGAALSLELSLFIPKGTGIILEFRLAQNLFNRNDFLRAEGQIIHCKMGEKQKYYLGVKFTQITPANLEHLLKLAGKA